MWTVKRAGKRKMTKRTHDVSENKASLKKTNPGHTFTMAGLEELETARYNCPPPKNCAAVVYFQKTDAKTVVPRVLSVRS